MSENPLELMAQESEEIKARVAALEEQLPHHMDEEWVTVKRAAQITGPVNGIFASWRVRASLAPSTQSGPSPLRIKRRFST